MKISLSPPTIPLSRKQRLWLAGLMTAAAALRLAGIDDLSLSHMDEGGYISSAMTVATGGPYSFPYSQALQSPPLLPWMIGGLVWLTQAQWPILGVLISAAFGTSSVLLLFLLGRRWGGCQFGLWAATLLAVSDFHIAYSRMVLTDVPLTFWFLLTLYCVTRMWEQTEAGSLANDEGRNDKKKRSSRQLPLVSPSHLWIAAGGWALAVGLAAGTAWNTKYNGWLVLAICIVAAGLWMTCRRLAIHRGNHPVQAPQAGDGMLIACLLLAGVVAAVCYFHWYLYVDRNFEGGYAAVTANHRGYFYSPAAWPRHVRSLIASLSALRHYGWILALGIVLGLGWRLAALARPDLKNVPSVVATALSILFAIGLAAVAAIQGSDAALLLLGAAGIVPALYSGSWQRLLAAVWCGTFVVLTPLYHPYPRLMLPALPACICLALWLLQDVWPDVLGQNLVQSDIPQLVSAPNRKRRVLASSALVAAALLSLIWLLGPHPFGLFVPTRGVWNRWTARQSYRAAGQAILEHTDADAIVICQTQLAMISYCQRTPLLAESHSFETLLPDFRPEHDCFLLVDYCWIHGEPPQDALRGIQNHARDLTPVAVIVNDLNVVALLDQLRPEEVAAKLAEPQAEYKLGGQEPFLPAPPPLSAPFEDVIVLYRVRLPLSR